MFDDRLKNLRKAKGVTQGEVAAALGIGESGKRADDVLKAVICVNYLVHDYLPRNLLTKYT